MAKLYLKRNYRRGVRKGTRLTRAASRAKKIELTRRNFPSRGGISVVDRFGGGRNRYIGNPYYIPRFNNQGVMMPGRFGVTQRQMNLSNALRATGFQGMVKRKMQLRMNPQRKISKIRRMQSLFKTR